MGCCNRDNDIENPNSENTDDLDTCCKIQGPCCMCLPYDDAFVIASMVMPMVAVLVSWVWYGTFWINIVGMILFQLFWCCRQHKVTLYLSVVVAAIASLSSMGAGIYVLVALRNKRGCYPWNLYSWGELNDPQYIENTDDYYKRDICQEVTWASIAFVCAALWAITAGCMLYFVHSGRHAKWEEARSKGWWTATATANIEVEPSSALESSESGRGPSITASTAMAMAVFPSATGGSPTIATATAVLEPESQKRDSTRKKRKKRRKKNQNTKKK